MLPEGTDQGWATAHPAQRPAGVLAQLAEADKAEVGQLVLFLVRPQIFDRVQFRSAYRPKLTPSRREVREDVPTDPQPERSSDNRGLPVERRACFFNQPVKCFFKKSSFQLAMQ